MKEFKFILLAFMVLFATSVFTSCGESSDSDANKDTTEQSEAEQDPEYTSAYVCPMHCEGSGSDSPGTCPVCGMDYVAKAELEKKDNHDDHEGHSH